MSEYKIISIERDLAPQGAQPGKWYCYVISNQYNTIVGYRSGTRSEVKNIADECVRRLNNQYRIESPKRYVQQAFGNDGIIQM